MTSYEYYQEYQRSPKAKIKRRIAGIIIGIVLILLILFLISFYFLFIHGTAITKPEYWKAKFIVVTRQVIGLDYEQCYEMLYKEPPAYLAEIYSQLIEYEGKKDRYTPVDYSYRTKFYVCSAYADNDLPSPYCYIVYFDKEQKAVYVEFGVDPISAVY